jgi:hypothetical protein
MFHFPAFPPNTLCIQVRVTRHDSCRVTPFGNPGITARLTAPPGISQPPTSFIGPWYQGIHHLPYTTSTNQDDHTNQPTPAAHPRNPKTGPLQQPPHVQAGQRTKTLRRKQDARVHYAHLNQQPTTPDTADTNPQPGDGMPTQMRSTNSPAPQRNQTTSPKTQTHTSAACFFRT